MTEALRIAIVGAESTGKTALAQALCERIAGLTGQRCAWVGEWLRTWCDAAGRTPRPDEQLAIAQHQQALIDAAAIGHQVVVCDTTALMTAVYSDYLFNDSSLAPYAIEQQRRCDITLLTALDIAWVPDGLQRDGPQVREPVDSRVRALLINHRLPWALVAGQGSARVESAVDAVAPLLRQRAGPASGLSSSLSSGLFTRLAGRDAADLAQRAAWTAVCDHCDAPDCEHLALARRRADGIIGRPHNAGETP